MHCGSSHWCGDGEKSSSLSCLLLFVCFFVFEVAGTGLSDRVDIKCEGMEEIKDDLYIFYLIS